MLALAWKCMLGGITLLFHVCSTSFPGAANVTEDQDESSTIEPELNISFLSFADVNPTIGFESNNLTSSCFVNNDSFVVTPPEKATRLDPERKVYFTVSLNWWPGLNVKFTVLTPEEIYLEENWQPEGVCGELHNKTFEVTNHGDNPGNEENPLSYMPELTVLVSIGTSDAARDDQDCRERLCKTYVLSYDFLPNPKNIKLHHSPKKIQAGEKGTVHCSNTDGSPVAKPFAIQVLDHETAEPILVANVTKLAMESSLAGKYQCLVLSHAFGKQTIVVSDMAVNVMKLFSREISATGTVRPDVRSNSIKKVLERPEKTKLSESKKREKPSASITDLLPDDIFKGSIPPNTSRDANTLQEAALRDSSREKSKSSADCVVSRCESINLIVAVSFTAVLLALPV